MPKRQLDKLFESQPEMDSMRCYATMLINELTNLHMTKDNFKHARVYLDLMEEHFSKAEAIVSSDT